VTIAVRDLAGDPITDPFRLAAVFNSGLLDTDPEASFDDLTRLAAMLIGTPFAFATIVDDRRSFWKSRFGIPAGGPKQNSVEESFCQYVVRSQSELIVGDAANDARTRSNPSVESMGVAAWAGFPLLDPAGEVLGSFCVVDTKTREWSAAELDILQTLARIASREIARQVTMNDERAAHVRAQALTHSLQASLLPPELPAVDGLDIAARFRAAGIGLDLVGDFYDLFATRDGWSFVLGDVCGKGLNAAKAATLARHAVGAACINATDPVDVMRAFNETFIARRDDVDLFLTAVYGTLERTADGCYVCLACAGHLPPIVRRADGSSYALDVNGPLIGIFPDLHISRAEVRLAPGESLIIYTDGVSEARGSGELYGEDAVGHVIATLDANADAATIATTIEQSAVAFSGGVASDDIAIIVIRVPA
jgi:serine phosphatase RsbU (regulator of sigma subunit)